MKNFTYYYFYIQLFIYFHYFNVKTFYIGDQVKNVFDLINILKLDLKRIIEVRANTSNWGVKQRIVAIARVEIMKLWK